MRTLNRQHGLAVTACAALVVLAACGGDDSGSAATTAVAPATGAATTTNASGISAEAAGDSYLKMVAPVNCAVARLNSDQQAVGKLPAEVANEAVTATVMPDYRTAGEAARQFAVDLRSAQWPAAVQQDIVTLADSATASSVAFLAAADAGSPEAFLSIVQGQSFVDTLDASASAADTVRQELNLEAVYNTTDFCALAEQ